MNPRSLLLLLIVTVAFLVAAVAVYTTRAPERPDTLEGEPLFPDLIDRINDVASITVRAATERVDLRFDNGIWRLDSRAGYPADFELAKQTVLGLAQLAIVEPKTADPARYDRLGVGALTASTPLEAQTFEIRLADEAGQPLVALIIGDRAVGAQTNHRYVRKPDEQQSFLASCQIPSISSSLSWIDRRVFEVDRARFRRVTIEHADGELIALSTDDAGNTWSVEEIPEGQEEVRPNIGLAVGTALATVRLDDVAQSDEFDGADPIASVHAETTDGLWIDARVFERDGDRWVIFESGLIAGVDADALSAESDEISRSTAGWAYQLSTFQTENLTKRAADLLQAVAPAEIESSPGG